MSDSSAPAAELRRMPRLKVPAMYTLVRVRVEGEDRYRWTGHIYDISLTGMRFELDGPIDAGTRVEVRGMLPGHLHTLFRATGPVVRIHDEDGEGPTRMGMAFESFGNPVDRRRLSAYIDDAGVRRAA